MTACALNESGQADRPAASAKTTMKFLTVTTIATILIYGQELNRLTSRQACRVAASSPVTSQTQENANKSSAAVPHWHRPGCFQVGEYLQPRKALGQRAPACRLIDKARTTPNNRSHAHDKHSRLRQVQLVHQRLSRLLHVLLNSGCRGYWAPDIEPANHNGAARRASHEQPTWARRPLKRRSWHHSQLATHGQQQCG